MHEIVQDLVADVPACVVVADGNARLIAASRQMLHLLGHTLPSLRELKVTDLAAAEDQEDSERLWEAFLRQRRQSRHFALRHRDGRVIRTKYVAVANLVGGLSIAVHAPVALDHVDTSDHDET